MEERNSKRKGAEEEEEGKVEFSLPDGIFYEI